MFGTPFLYYLVDELGRSIKWLGSTITRKATPTRLDYTPDGWMDKSLQLQRNSRYFGLFREFVPKLNFVKDGAAILRYFYYNYSVEAKLWLVILRRLPTGVHTDLFKGEIDFTQFSDQTLDSGAGVVASNCLDGGIPKYLKANENTTYDIPLEDADAVKIRFHGLGLFAKFFFASDDYEVESVYIDNPAPYTHYVPLQFLRIDGKSGGISSNFQIPDVFYNIFDTPNYLTNYLNKSDIGTTVVTFNATFDLLINDDTVGVAFFLWDGTGTVPQANIFRVYGNFDGQSAGTTLHIDISNVTRTLTEGKTLTFLARIAYATPPLGGSVIYQNMNVTTEAVTAAPASNIRGYTARQMFDKLFTKVTEGVFLNRSTLLDEKDDYILIPEDELRSYPEPKFRTDFKQFFDFCRVQFMAGFGNNGRYGEIERLDFFFDTTQIADLGDAKGVKIEPFNEQLYSAVKIGYEDISLSDTNGATDPNNNLTFSTPLKRPGKTLELICPYAASMYLMEYLRIEKKDVSEDKVPGNKVFLVKIDRSTVNDDGSYNLLLHADWTVTGLIDPATAFNLDLSPMRLLQLNGDFIASFCHRYENSRVAFTSSQKPVRMVADGIDEHVNVYVNTLGTPIFLPYSVNFSVALPMLSWDQLNTARSGTFQFNVRGNAFTGFAQDVKVKPATDEEQEMTLLLAPGNDVTTLINAD